MQTKANLVPRLGSIGQIKTKANFRHPSSRKPQRRITNQSQSCATARLNRPKSKPKTISGIHARGKPQGEMQTKANLVPPRGFNRSKNQNQSQFPAPTPATEH